MSTENNIPGISLGKVFLEYYRDATAHNTPHLNERTIEVPLGHYFLDRHASVLELGAVMPYYGRRTHTVIDPADPYKAAVRMNAEDCDWNGKTVLSISTVEHIGLGQYGLSKGEADAGFRVLQSIVKNASIYLVTWPLGQNPKLDNMVRKAGDIKRIVLKRTNEANEWTIANQRKLRYKYDHPYNNGNALCVVTNIGELHPKPWYSRLRFFSANSTE